MAEQLYQKNVQELNLVSGPFLNHLIIAAILGLLAVLLGAFGAHGLESAVEEGRLKASLLESWHTAVEYQYYHVFALLVTALIGNASPVVLGGLKRSGWLFIAGIALFSGSLYLMAAADLMGQEWRWLGPVTPIGGLLLAAGWTNMLITFIGQRKAA